jgi:hypothetical protein
MKKASAGGLATDRSMLLEKTGISTGDYRVLILFGGEEIADGT